ncbi:MAG: hypothetical protein M3R38_07315 [Actinomycetota bacterium]|nr:hypothetical protein [Actinomycetota bacterium]
MAERPIDLTDERTITTKLGGKPVFLTPQPDGTIAVTEHRGQPPRILSIDGVWAELSAGPSTAEGTPAADEPSDDELLAAFAEVRTGDAPATPEADASEDDVSLSETDDEGDPAADLSDDALFNAWKASHEAERGVDLAEASTDALKPGDAVEWGEGFGVGHGIVQEVDTAEGTVNVHTCEVVTEGGAGEQLSPTGRTIKLKGKDLRRSTLKLVGTEPLGPELSADLADDPDVGTESDDSFFERVMRQMRRAGGGFGAQ